MAPQQLEKVMDQNTTLTTLDLINLVAAITSILLAIIAMVLSIMFYRWSDKANREIVTVSQAIDNNTKKIENLFDKLYSDTFGIMKSNVEAMQKQLYQSLSSGDSSLKDSEIIEESIMSIMTKSKIVTKESITHIIQKINSSKNFSEPMIMTIVSNLEKDGRIFIKDNMISLGNNDSKTEESESE